MANHMSSIWAFGNVVTFYNLQFRQGFSRSSEPEERASHRCSTAKFGEKSAAQAPCLPGVNGMAVRCRVD
jgi:hypothetical protein